MWKRNRTNVYYDLKILTWDRREKCGRVKVLWRNHNPPIYNLATVKKILHNWTHLIISSKRSESLVTSEIKKLNINYTNAQTNDYCQLFVMLHVAPDQFKPTKRYVPIVVKSVSIFPKRVWELLYIISHTIRTQHMSCQKIHLNILCKDLMSNVHTEKYKLHFSPYNFLKGPTVHIWSWNLGINYELNELKDL